MSTDPSIAPTAPTEVRGRLALALDLDDLVAATRLARELQPWFGVVKVGLELFSANGPDAISAMRDMGLDVFADLKLHDIPTTVGKSAKVLGSLGASYLTLHAHGDVPMLRAGVEGLADGAESVGLPATHGACRHGAHERRRCAAAHPSQAGSHGGRGRLRWHRLRRR